MAEIVMDALEVIVTEDFDMLPYVNILKSNLVDMKGLKTGSDDNIQVYWS